MKKHLVRIFPLAIALAAALPAAAQSASYDVTRNPLSQALLGIIDFINAVAVPFLFAIAFALFLWGVFLTFIAGGTSEEKRGEGKKFIGWGIVAFVVMVSLWGIVNLLVYSLGFRSLKPPPIPTFDSYSAPADSRNDAASEPVPCPAGATCIPGTNIPEGIY